MKGLFIHIPKTGGIAIIEALGLRRADHLRKLRWGYMKDDGAHHSLGHIPYRLCLPYIPESIRKNSFKFAFCRNPFDRVVSHWAYTMNHHPEFVPPGTEFLEFTREFIHHKRLRPQSTWVKNVHIDYLGRFERLEECIKEVASILDIEMKPLRKRNSSEHDHYTKYYCEESIENVINRYKDDFEMFGYSEDITDGS